MVQNPITAANKIKQNQFQGLFRTCSLCFSSENEPIPMKLLCKTYKIPAFQTNPD
jgi:hypothetical protein